MKILLIMPPSEIVKESNNGAIRRKVGLLPQLGVLTIASVLEKNGCEIKIIDGQLINPIFREIIEDIKSFKPDLIGVSFITAQKHVANKLINDIRDSVCCPIVVGGAHPTCFPKDTMQDNENIDILMYDEGEESIMDLIGCIKRKESFREVKGIIYRDGNSIIKNPKPSNPVDIDKLPFPARHLLPIHSYAPSPFENKKSPSTSIIISRGCMYSRCTFCYRASNMKKSYRCQSIKKTKAEIDYLVKRYGIKELVFYDDNLLANRNCLDKLCDYLIDKRYDLIWSFRGRSCNADYKILEKAKRAGCWNIEIGFESGNQDLLDKIQKGITLKQSKDMARWCNKLGIETVGTFIVALPGETYEKGMNTVNFAIDIGCSYAAFIPAHPDKGTPFYEQCIKEGRIVQEYYTDESKLSWFIPKISYLPDGYKNEASLRRLIRISYLKFYFRPSYVFRNLINIRGFYDINRYFNGLKFILGIFKK